jgi:hypothetical protein
MPEVALGWSCTADTYSSSIPAVSPLRFCSSYYGFSMFLEEIVTENDVFYQHYVQNDRLYYVLFRSTINVWSHITLLERII